MDDVNDRDDFLRHLNFQTPELQFDFDSNDLLARNISTKYFSEENVITNSFDTKDKLFLMHHNVRSLNKNMNQFHSLIQQLNYGYCVVGLSETWLNDLQSSIVSIDGFTLYTNNREHKRGGGVGFYVSNNL